MTGMVIGGMIPALVFGGYGVMQKVCMRSGLGIAPFFTVVGGTVAVAGMVLSCLIPGGVLSLEAGLFATGYGLFWSLGVSLILLAVDRLGASISQLVPLYNTGTLVTVALGLLVFAEWKQVQTVPLLAGAIVIVTGTVIVTRAERAATAGPTIVNASGLSFLRARKAPVIIGGLIPAFVLGIAGAFMKASMRSGLGVGAFLAVVGGTMVLFGLGLRLLTAGRAITRSAALSGIFTGVLWALGTGLVLLALRHFGSSVSQLSPLYNMNTLVVVLLGLWIFAEAKQVRPAVLLTGAALIISGAVLVAMA